MWRPTNTDSSLAERLRRFGRSDMSPEEEEAALTEVERFIRAQCKSARRSPTELFASAIRNAIDEVVDGPRTGRWSLDALSNPEKTYVGIKLEIIVKAALGVPGSTEQDAEIAGHHVNIKWSKSLAWMIGPENINSICLGLGTTRDGRRFSVGLFRATSARLRAENRDKKRSLTAKSYKDDVRWIVHNEVMLRNFVESLPASTRNAIFAEKSAQGRITKLITLVQGIPIPREAFYTVALDKRDPMRRLRRDKYRTGHLGGMKVFSASYGREELARRGFTNVPKDHFISLPE
jgi:hypothetical protein